MATNNEIFLLVEEFFDEIEENWQEEILCWFDTKKEAEKALEWKKELGFERIRIEKVCRGVSPCSSWEVD